MFGWVYRRRKMNSGNFKMFFQLGSRTTYTTSKFRWGSGELFLSYLLSKSNLRHPRWSTGAKSIARAKSIAHFTFGANFAHLEIHF